MSFWNGPEILSTVEVLQTSVIMYMYIYILVVSAHNKI